MEDYIFSGQVSSTRCQVTDAPVKRRILPDLTFRKYELLKCYIFYIQLFITFHKLYVYNQIWQITNYIKFVISPILL